MLGWLKDRVLKDFDLAPPMLWHYTDAGGLGGIVSGNLLWATDARFLNDAEELSYGIERARHALEQHQSDPHDEVTARFLNGLGDPEQAIVPRFLNRSLDAYVSCFCADGDLLSQWRGYAGSDSGGGYALGFKPPRNAFAWPQSNGHGLALRRVIYDVAEQDRLLNDLITTMVAILARSPTDIPHQNAFARHLVDGLVEAATWCKHPSFREEGEWRIVYVRSNDPDDKLTVQHRPRGGVVVPYVALELNKKVGVGTESLPIAFVNCGPGPEPELKRRGVMSLLATNADYAGVEVGVSVVPLRI